MKASFRLCLIVLLLLFINNTLVEAQKNIFPRKNISGKYGYIDKSESFIINAKYDKAFSFEINQAKVIVKGKWGLIDISGNYIIKPKLTYIGWSNDGYFKWNKKNLTLTNTLIPPTNTFYPRSDGVYAYLSKSKWGIINPSGRLLKNEWDSIYYAEGGHFAVYLEGKGWTWIDAKNKSPNDKYFAEVKPLSNGLIAARNFTEKNFRIYDFEGLLQSDSIYRHIENLNSEFIKARNHQLWHQIDKNANVLGQEAYEEIKYVPGNNTMQYLPFSPWLKSTINFKNLQELGFSIRYKVKEGLYVIIQDDEKALWNTINNNKIKLESNDSVFFDSTFINIKSHNNSRIQLLTTYLQKISESILAYRILDTPDLVMLNDKAEKWSIWNISEGRSLISNIDSNYTFLSNEELKLSRDGKYGLFNIVNNIWVIDPLYENIYLLNDTLKAVISKDSINFYGENGFSRSMIEVTDVLPINDSILALKESSGKWTLRDINFNKILKNNFVDVAPAGDYSIRMQNLKGWLLYNFLFSKYILKNSYDSISENQNGYFVIQKDDRWGIIDNGGNFTFQLSNYYKQLFYFNETRWQVYRNGLSGIVDQNGTLKISTQYEDFKQPEFGYIPFKFRSKWGLLDQKERFILQPLNDRLEIISHDLIQVWKDGKTGIKNNSDKTLIPIDFHDIERTKNGAYIVKQDHKYGYYDSDVQQIRPVSYDAIKEFSNNLIALNKNGYWQLINKKGQLVSNKKFAHIHFDSKTQTLYFKEKKSWLMKSLD